MDLDKAGETRLLQLNELNEFRMDAYENSVIYKERTKHWHDKHIRQRVFQVGDQVTRDDFFHHLLEHVIQHCGWHKVADAPHVAYPTLVRKFFANFNLDIDVPVSLHIYKTWVRGQWIRFSPTMIDSGLCLTHGVSLFPTEEADPLAPLLNARSVENSETKIAAGGSRVHATPAMNAGEDYPDDAAPAPPLDPAADLGLSIQLTQLMAAQTEMSWAIGTI
ncbi:Uncharacterized protein Adt_03988 [Abeliophyllum distichum]|uniref:Uncharacterized protein n=1 Tax=Abeliophyllum distichum TaxID=126358 RepID=A0ABD1W0I7_9LAMI